MAGNIVIVKTLLSNSGEPVSFIIIQETKYEKP